MTEEISKTAIMEVVKRVQIEEGDILIVRTMDNDILATAAQSFSELYPGMNFLLVEESGLDVLREADEELMRSLGWQRIKEE